MSLVKFLSPVGNLSKNGPALQVFLYYKVANYITNATSAITLSEQTFIHLSYNPFQRQERLGVSGPMSWKKWIGSIGK